THAFPQRPLLLRLQTHHETGYVNEENERNVEGVTQLHEMDLLARRMHIHRPAVHHRIVGDNAHGAAAHACQHRDDRFAVGRTDLEPRVAIDDHLHQTVHAVGLRALLRHDSGQLFITAVDRVCRFHHRRQFPDIARHVAEEAADLFEGLFFRTGGIVNGAGGVHRHLGAAQIILVDRLTQGTFHHGWASRENLTGAAHHHGKVRKNRAACGAAGCRSQNGRDHGHFTQQFHGTLETMDPRKYAVTAALDRGHTAARAVDQIHEGNAVVVSQVFNEPALAPFATRAAECRAAPHGEVFTPEGNGPTINTGEACDIGRRCDGDQSILGVVGTRTRQRTHFTETARVSEFLDAFAHGESAILVLLLDGLLSPHLEGFRAPKRQFRERMVCGVCSGRTLHGGSLDRGVVVFTHDSTTHRIWSSSTLSPGATVSSATTPSFVASTGISIFMDSRIMMTSPSCTASPTARSTFHTVPVTGEPISTRAIPCLLNRVAPPPPRWGNE